MNAKEINCDISAYGQKPIELKQDLKAIENRDFRHIFHISDEYESFEMLEIMLYLNSDFENLPNFHQQYSKAMFMLNDWFKKSLNDDLAEVAK